MTRVMFYSMIVLVLVGLDLTVNRGAVTDDLASAMVSTSKTAQNAIYATAGFMSGKR